MPAFSRGCIHFGIPEAALTVPLLQPLTHRADDSPSRKRKADGHHDQLLFLTAAMLGVTWQARRLGNERRDLELLAVTTGLLGARSTVSALV